MLAECRGLAGLGWKTLLNPGTLPILYPYQQYTTQHMVCVFGGELRSLVLVDNHQYTNQYAPLKQPDWQAKGVVQKDSHSKTSR